MTTSNITHAPDNVQALLNLDLYVFPCCAPIGNGECSADWHSHSASDIGKRPLTSHGFKDASNDPEQVDAWSDEFPGCNWGVSAPHSNLVILDEDSEWELDRLFGDLGLRLPETFTVRTGGGGRHLYLRTTPNLRATSGLVVTQYNLRPDYEMDVRVDTGLVIAPGSQHLSGEFYRVLNSAPLVDCPEPLADFLIARAKRRQEGISATDMPSVGTYADAQALLDRYRVISGGRRSAVRALFDHQMGEDSGRYLVQWRLIKALREFGMSTEDIFTVAVHAGCNKFRNRRQDLWSQVQNAIAEVDAKKADKMTKGSGTQTLDRGQIRMAHRLVAEHSGDLRYVHGLGWYVWDGMRWEPDQDGAAGRFAIATVKQAKHEAIEMTDRTDAKELEADARTCSSDGGLQGMLNIAKSLKPMSTRASDLDSNPYLFNTRNGTLNLDAMTLQAHNPDDLITRVAVCGYDPNATGESFLRAVEEILPDPEVRDYLQRLVGYSMLGLVREAVLPLCIGEGGNGKSLLLEVIRKTFGDYGAAPASSLLLQKKQGASTTDLVDLRGKRFVVCAETDEGNRMAAATVKTITGGDAITARRLYQDFVTFNPSHTVFLMTNHEPQTDGNDPALFRRLRKIRFTEKFEGERQIADLPERLASEYPVILRWIVDGFRRYDVAGLKEPESVIRDTESYRLSNDPLGSFIADCLVECEGGFISGKELADTYNEYRGTVTGPGMIRPQGILKKLKDRSFEWKRKNTGAGIVGWEFVTVSDEMAS